MSALSHRIASRLRRYIANRRKIKRANARLSFTVAISDPRMSPNGSRRVPSLDGHTLDVSPGGMGLVVPAIRIGEHYLTGEDRRLHVKLELPGGPVEMYVAPVRYEGLEEDQLEKGYVIGARIIEMSQEDRSHFEEYVRKVLRKEPVV